MGTVINFTEYRAKRRTLSGLVSELIEQLAENGITLDTQISVGAVLTDLCELARVLPPLELEAWQDTPIA